MKPIAIDIARKEFDKNILAKRMLNSIEKVIYP